MAGAGVADAERRLVDRYLQQRDEDAFRALYEVHAGFLWGFVLRLAGHDEHEAEDVFQETWMTAVRSLSGFRWDAALRSWLCGIALNVWRGRVRRAWRETPGSVEDHPSTPLRDPGAAMDIERAVASLPDGYRSVLLLYGVYGYTHAEIAERLGIAEGTSKSQLARARQALRRALTNGRVGEEHR